MEPEAKPAKTNDNSENSAPASVSDPLPRRFERFTLLRHLARGGMGEVYLATSAGIEGAERPGVIKIIRREHAEDRSFLARFLDEARIQAQLQHPGVAQIVEASTDATGKPYVVVEYVEGRNLSEVRQRSIQLGARIAWPDAVAVALCIADALAHVHERTDASGNPLDIVHRDLSPQNVMVSYSGDVKLIDFGTARGQNRRCQTIAGIVFAKPGYVAPEVANNTPGSAPADVYALGIMLWELLAGRRFLTGDASEHLAAVAAGQRNPPAIAHLIDAPRDLDAIIARLTAARIEDRYTARDATMDLVLLLKRAPSLADGERSVRARVAHLMQRLYPAEPARSRAEFARLVASARHLAEKPAPATTESAEAPSDPDLLAGTRYRLVREIGRGGMGVVFEAYHLDLARTVALKVLPPDQSGSPDSLDRFRAEARAIARVEHGNLVRFHDFGISADGQPYFAMELLEGETLDGYLSRERGMDYRDAVKLVLQACRALTAAHGAGLVHRDIKPANLFVTRDGTLKLLDFGVAFAMSQAATGNPDLSQAPLAVVGTPEYMAPEQTRVGADVRCDLYALGTVLYELVTGSLPHQADSTVSLLDAKLKVSPELPTKRAPERGLPKALDRVIERVLSIDPEQRYQTAAEFADALERVLQIGKAQTASRRRVFMAAAALACVSGIAGLAVAKQTTWSQITSLPLLRKALPAAHTLSAVTPAVAGRIDEAVDATAELAVAPPPAVQHEPEPQPELAGTTPEAPVAAQQAGAEVDQDGEQQDAEQEATPADPAEAVAEAPAPEAPSQDALARRIESARALMAAGKEIKGFGELRYLGKSHYGDARALRAWSEAAARMKAWGEAARTARRWAELDSSLEAQLHLAKMERAVGQRERATLILKRLVRKNPDSTEARELLASLGWDPERIARR